MLPGLRDGVAANLPDGAEVAAVEPDSRIAVHLWNDHDDLTRALTAPRRAAEDSPPLRIHRR
jgi:hypothetical protein